MAWMISIETTQNTDVNDVKVLLQTANSQYVEFRTPFFVEILMCKI
jgi:hypothetical protein